MTSEIDKLKHFHVEDYSGTNFTDDLNDGYIKKQNNKPLINKTGAIVFEMVDLLVILV